MPSQKCTISISIGRTMAVNVQSPLITSFSTRRHSLIMFSCLLSSQFIVLSSHSAVMRLFLKSFWIQRNNLIIKSISPKSNNYWIWDDIVKCFHNVQKCINRILFSFKGFFDGCWHVVFACLSHHRVGEVLAYVSFQHPVTSVLSKNEVKICCRVLEFSWYGCNEFSAFSIFLVHVEDLAMPWRC